MRGATNEVIGDEEVERLRSATPGCGTVVHLNNAGAGLMSVRVLDTVVAHLRAEASSGGYEAADAAAAGLERAHADLARLLGARRDEVAITGSDTVGWAKAFWGLEHTGWFGSPDRRRPARVLVDRFTYNSHHLALLQATQRNGLVVDVLPSLSDGSLDAGRVAEVFDDDVRAVCATAMGTHVGVVNPVEMLAPLARAVSAPFFVDACQSVGQRRVDVDELGCDVLTATGRKFLRGPRGTGLLYVSSEWSERMDPPGVDGSSATWSSSSTYRLAPGAGRFEEFERPVAAVLGLGVAVEEALEVGLERIATRVDALAADLRAGLEGLDGVRVTDWGDGVSPDTRLGAIVTCVAEGVPAGELRDRLAAARINASVSSAPWAQLDMAGEPDRLRLSPHYFNTAEELELVLEVLASAVG